MYFYLFSVNLYYSDNSFFPLLFLLFSVFPSFFFIFMFLSLFFCLQVHNRDGLRNKMGLQVKALKAHALRRYWWPNCFFCHCHIYLQTPMVMVPDSYVWKKKEKKHIVRCRWIAAVVAILMVIVEGSAAEVRAAIS